MNLTYEEGLKKGYRLGMKVGNAKGIKTMRDAALNCAYGDDYGNLYILPDDVKAAADKLLAQTQEEE